MESAALRALITRYRRRLTVAASLRAGLNALLWGALAAIVLAILCKLAGVSRLAAACTLLCVPVSSIAGVICTSRRNRLSDYKAAKLLDAGCKLNDRLSSAFWLLEQKDLQMSPFVTLAIHDGLAAAQTVQLGSAGFAWTRRFTLGAAMCVLAAVWGHLLYPPLVIPPEQAVAQQTQQDLQKMLRGLGSLPGISDEQKEDFKKLLEELNISEEEMNKMSQADIMRLLNEKGIKYKGGQKASAFEAVKNAMADLEFQKQMAAEIEKKNNEEYPIALANGGTLKATRLKTEAPNEQVMRAQLQQALGVKGPSDSEELDELQRQEELVAENARKARSKIGLRNDPAAQIDTQALLATNEQFRKDTEEAIADPNGAAAKRVKNAYKEILKREIEKGEIPAAKAEKLQHLMRME